jgi:hypothetical protein
MLARVKSVIDGHRYPSTDFEETDTPGLVIVNGSPVELPRAQCVVIESVYTKGNGRRDEWQTDHAPGLSVGSPVDVEIRAGRVVSVRPL